jgi:hypothetical protein
MLRHQKILEGGHCEIRALLALLEAVVTAATAAVCSAVLVRVNVPHDLLVISNQDDNIWF